VPAPLAPPAGCGFSTRCPYVLDACRAEHPTLRQGAKHHLVRCLNPAASTEFTFGRRS